jgi:hypothetical protein
MTLFCLDQPHTKKNVPSGRPGTTEMGTLVTLIHEIIKNGVPHANEKSRPVPKPARTRSAGIRGRRRAKFTITDGPFAETKELIAGGTVC